MKTDDLVDIVLEQAETIILLVESIKTGGVVNENNIAEMLERAYRIREKVRKLRGS